MLLPANSKDPIPLRLDEMREIEVFFSYAHEDEDLRNELEKHLSILQRQGIIKAWHDREISAGTEWAGEIDAHLNTAQVILLLISADFLASNYCYDIELRRAMERHVAREARVIPVILREVDWKGANFGKLQALPTNAEPVANWASRDRAFADIARGIRKAVEELVAVDDLVQATRNQPEELAPQWSAGAASSDALPQSQPGKKSVREETPSQSISISGSQVSGQFGQAGRDLNQTQLHSQDVAEKQLTPAEVAELIAQMEILFSNSDLSEEQKEKALKYLETAKEEIQETEPDKNFAAKRLQRAIKALKEANGIRAGQGWQELERITSKLAPWFGVTLDFFVGL